MLASAYEGMAWAYAVSRDPHQARRYIQMAPKQLESVNEEEDRKIYTHQTDETMSLIET